MPTSRNDPRVTAVFPTLTLSGPLAIAIFVLAAAPLAHAQPAAEPVAKIGDCAIDFASVVQAHYESVSDFRASFRQVTRSITLGQASLGADAPSHGVVQFAKPGKMRWHYLAPVESLVVSDNEIMWIFDPVRGEAQRLPVTDGYLTGAALEFLLGDGQILEEFEVSTSSCIPDSSGMLRLKLVPRKPASFEYLGLTAKLGTGEISGTELIDLFGNETSISFSEMRTNLNPTDGTFEFEVPDGVQVIDLVVTP
jgi:outer membrane lipoprotein carrier protein